MEAFTRAFPEAPRTELYWRFKFVGVTTHIQADADRTGEYTADLSGVDEMVGRMVAFLAAGPFAGAAAAGSGEEGASL